MVLTFLATGTAYSEQPPNKPFKVCPEVVTAKDTPCRVLGPTAVVVNRQEKPDTSKQDRERVRETIRALRMMADLLEKDLEKSDR